VDRDWFRAKAQSLSIPSSLAFSNASLRLHYFERNPRRLCDMRDLERVMNLEAGALP
jgi:hypothetical protein